MAGQDPVPFRADRNAPDSNRPGQGGGRPAAQVDVTVNTTGAVQSGDGGSRFDGKIEIGVNGTVRTADGPATVSGQLRRRRLVRNNGVLEDAESPTGTAAASENDLGSDLDDDTTDGSEHEQTRPDSDSSTAVSADSRTPTTATDAGIEPVEIADTDRPAYTAHSTPDRRDNVPASAASTSGRAEAAGAAVGGGNQCPQCWQRGGVPAGDGCTKCAGNTPSGEGHKPQQRASDALGANTPRGQAGNSREANRYKNGADGGTQPPAQEASTTPRANRSRDAVGADRTGSAGGGSGPANRMSAMREQAVAGAADKALEGAAASTGPLGTVALKAGKKLLKRRNAKKAGQSGKPQNKTGSGKTGPGSGTSSSTKKKAIAAAVAVSMLLLALPIMLIAILGGGGAAQEATMIDLAVSSRDADNPPEGYLKAYIAAGRAHDIPWTLLAGIAKVTTEQGRISQSDIADYGELIDRAPERGPLNTGKISFNSKGAPAPGTEIRSVGDSILVGAGPAFDKAMTDAGYTASHDGQVGASISALNDKITTAFAQGAGVVIIQAGINDIAGGVNETTYRQRIQTVLNNSGTTCVVWVNLASTYGGTYENLAPAARRFNVVLNEELSQHPNARLADFSSVASRATQDNDGLHLNAAGNKAWVDTVSRAVATCGLTAPVDDNGTPNGATAPDNTTPASPTPTAPPAMTSGGTQSVYISAPEYSQYSCSNGTCGPNPKMGISEGEPIGPFALDPTWVKKRGGGSFNDGNFQPGTSFDPHDIGEAADALAEELATIRDELVKTEARRAYPKWETDPEDAAALWDEVLTLAPVIWPTVATGRTTCPTPQPATLTWPLTAPAAVTEQGTDTVNGVSVLNAGMTLTGTGPVTAASSGTVATVVTTSDGTTQITITHSDGITTTTGGIASTTLTTGATVAPGDTLGNIGNTGVVSFEVRLNGSIVNPRQYVIGGNDLPHAGTTVNPQQGSSTDTASDPQAGTPIDPCTGRPIVAAGAGAPAATSPDPGGTPGGQRPGTLVIPVAGVGPTDLDDTWGAPRSGGRTHKGIDIIRPIGTPVVAAAAGVINDRFDVGQPCTKHSPPSRVKAVTVIGDDGHRYYYAHLNTIEVSAGQRVTPGQRLGTVGETGNACWSVPHLHFSIDESTDAPINPYPILAKGLSISEAAAGGRGLGTGTGGGMMSGGGTTSAVAYAVYFGGLVQGDPDAGRLPTWAGGGSFSSGFTQSGNFAPGTLSPKGREVYDSNPAIAEIIMRNFPPEQQDNALRIAACESNLGPTVVGVNKNKDGSVASRDHGLFQFNDAGTLQTYLKKTGEDERNIQRAYDPEWSARAAYLLWQDHGWGRWSCAKMPTDKFRYRTGIWVDGAPGPGNTSGEYAGEAYLAGYGTAP